MKPTMGEYAMAKNLISQATQYNKIIESIIEHAEQWNKTWNAQFNRRVIEVVREPDL